MTKKKKATTFDVCVKTKTKKNTYRVYIRITHGGDSRFIFCGKVVRETKVKGKQVTDSGILKYCYTLIEEYRDKLKKLDPTNWTVDKIVEVPGEDENIPFIEFCKEYISGLYEIIKHKTHSQSYNNTKQKDQKPTETHRNKYP